MARKSLAVIDPQLAEAAEEFKDISEIRYELAMDVYNAQDAKTKVVIDKIVATLQQFSKTDNEIVGWNLMYLATEIVKDLAFMDIRVAEFEFPVQMCAMCGVVL